MLVALKFLLLPSSTFFVTFCGISMFYCCKISRYCVSERLYLYLQESM